MSGDQEKSTTSPGAEQAPNPPALPQYPPQPFPGGPYPPPPGAYTWYYPPPADPNGDPNAPPPGPYVMFPPPGIMYGYPPPPTPTQVTQGGYGPFPASTPASIVARAKRKQVKMACTNCASACKRCDEARPCQRCQKYGLTESCVDGVRKARKVGVKRGPYKRKSKGSAPDAAPYSGFPPTGEGPWVAPSDQPDGAPPGATPPIAAQYMPPEGYWSYPYYPPPHGYVPPPPDGHANGDGAPHGQPAHPAYYPVHPGYPPVSIYPPPPGAYGPIPTPSGQAPAPEQTESNQAAASDDSRTAMAERPKKKKRAGGEEGVSKTNKKSKRATNSTSEAPAPVVATALVPTSADSPDDHGSPVVHNTEPLPPVIAAA